MLCPSCSNPLVPGSRFCTHCGAHLSVSTPPPPARYSAFAPLPRVQRHLQTAGILWCVYGAYRIITGLVGILVLRAFTFRNFDGYGWPFNRGFGPGWPGAFLPAIAIMTLVSTALAFFVGYSLLQRKPWGRTLAIVVAILALFRPLLGTALGIYTLWLLVPAASGLEYEAVADRT